MSLKHNFFAVIYRISAVETVKYSLAVFFSFSLSFRKGVFPLRKRNWRLKIDSFARHEDTGLACSLFPHFFRFCSGVKNSNPKEKVGRSSSSAGSLVAICS